MITITLLAGVGVWSTYNYLWRIPSPQSSSHNRALVVDQLALNYPDPSFVTNVTSALRAAGYGVDYSGPSATAIDYFKHLPEQGYDLIIIRAHQGSSQAIITTEPYSRSEYLAEQLDGRIVPAQVGNGPVYFALTPRFVHQDMVGSFPGSTIIVMGCAALQGLKTWQRHSLTKEPTSSSDGTDSSASSIPTPQQSRWRDCYPLGKASQRQPASLVERIPSTERG